MGRARRLLRGRGRALALVAAASVAWLLLDVAALRLSFGGGAAGPRAREGRRGAPGPGPGAGPGAGPGPGADPGAPPTPPARPPKPESGAGRRRSGALTAAAGSVAGSERRAGASRAAGAEGRGGAGGSPGRPGAGVAAAAAPPGLTPGAAPAGAGAAPAAVGAAADVGERPVGAGAAPGQAAPSQDPPDRPPGPGAVAAGLAERTGRNGTGTSAARAAEAMAQRSSRRPASPPGAEHGEGLPARAAAPRAPSNGGAAVAGQPAARENPFVRISKERERAGPPTTPRPSTDFNGNSTRSPERRPERHRQSSEGVPVARTASAVSSSLRKAEAAPAEGPGTAGAAAARPAKGGSRAPHAARSPGTHRVLAMDVTLAPRDPRAPGQFGHAVAVPEDKQEEAKSRWKEGNFNVYLSDLIPVDRAIVDTRPAGCSEQQVHNDLPTTTIIMCFVDEVWSTLLRSVHSVLSRSPPHLIEEVILVDDCSTKDYLKEKLDKYMSQFPKVKIIHLKERHGLIRARLAGAEIAKGDVLTFLDSHVECNVGWLEPLLERVRLSRTKVACPVIEVISDKDMSYMTVDNFQRGIFTWPMNFGWRQIPQEVVEKNKIKETDIIRCPVMAGGLFSIDKKYFFELGTYDPGLDVWGGENMEISFKVWMCGGEIEIVPCSRVGHIFRNDNPYSFPKDRISTVERNLARVAEVWLDEYKDLFYGHAYHLILKNLDVGDLTQQIELRKKLQCKSFKWYLENVYPDLDAPLVKADGLLVNAAVARCVSVEGTAAALEPCDVNDESQRFNYTWLRLLQHGEGCVAPAGAAVGLQPCDPRDHRLKWLHMSLAAFQPELMDHVVVEHLPQPACLEADPAHKTLRVNACNSSSPYQKWRFGNYYAD